MDSHHDACLCPDCEEEARAGHGGDGEEHYFCHVCESAGCTEESARCQGPRFPLGLVVATPGALVALVRTGQDVSELLDRHQHGDWGVVGNDDAATNDKALASGGRIHSIYPLRDGTLLWIMTGADRSSTCLLLPEEY